MKIVLDTNVLIAAFIAHGVCSELLEHCVRHYDLISSDYILKEFKNKLITKFRFTSQEAKQASHLLKSRMNIVRPLNGLRRISRDKKDDPVIGTALAGNCDCIITGDKDLLTLKKIGKISIVSPGGFWKLEDKQ